MADTSKPRFVFHDPELDNPTTGKNAGKKFRPYSTRDKDKAQSYLIDHSYMGTHPIDMHTHHPDGRVEKQTFQPGEIVEAMDNTKRKYAFKGH